MLSRPFVRTGCEAQCLSKMLALKEPEPQADENQNGGEDKTQARLGYFGDEHAAENDARNRSHHKRPQQVKVYRAEPPMLEAGNEGEWNRMGDVRADKACG